jgi:hypothetical protein
MPPKRPSKGFLTRDLQRHLLTLHFALFVGGVAVAAWLNRTYSPERLWFQWVALPWLALLGVHLASFSRVTIASMTGGSGGGSKLPPT